MCIAVDSIQIKLDWQNPWSIQHDVTYLPLSRISRYRHRRHLPNNTSSHWDSPARRADNCQDHNPLFSSERMDRSAGREAEQLSPRRNCDRRRNIQSLVISHDDSLGISHFWVLDSQHLAILPATHSSLPLKVPLLSLPDKSVTLFPFPSSKL